nr:Rv2175c family DNA-binding protein [Micromonospora sp. DSM 115978]
MFTLAMDWLTLPDAAERLGVPVTRVRQMVRDRTVLASRRDGILMVPAAFIHDGEVVKGLPGLLTVLADSGFTEEESMEWLFREDPSLPGTPVQALAENRGREVKRRAQALAF